MSMFWRQKALLCKIETIYGTDPVPTGAANAILASDVAITPMEGQDVSRELERPYFGAQPTIPVGKHAKLTFSAEVKGAGAVTPGTPPAYGPCLRACGLAEVIVAGTSVTYNPVTTGIESATFYLNISGTLFKLIGTRGTATYRVTAQGLAKIEFEFTGLWVKPVDQAMPTVNLATQLDHKPQVATTANTPTLTLGAFAPVTRSMSFALGNAVETRFLIGSESVLITDHAESVEMVTGVDVMGPYKGRYSSLEEGLALARSLGHDAPWLSIVADLREIHPSEANVGDIAMLDDVEGIPAMGVVQGEAIYALHPRGIGLVPLLSARRVWSV